jgi:hypothetical protein
MILMYILTNKMITGEEFNKKYKDISFVKLTNHECNHNGFQFKEGLNEDILKFDSREKCGAGGLYFCNYKDFGIWTEYNKSVMKYIWDVTIMDDAKVVVMDNKIKCNKFILSNKRSIWNNKEICLEAVKQNGHALKYVKEQTEEMCLEAVKQNGFALMHVKEKTEEMCLEAVKKDGAALKYVKEQTEEMCLESVKQDENALKYVKE